MAIYKDEEQELANRLQEVEDRNFALQAERERQAHEAELVRIRAVEARKKATVLGRGERRMRIIFAIIKAPSLILLAIFLPLLILSKREVPAFLQDYINL